MAQVEVAGMAEAANIVGVTKSNFSAHRAKYAGEEQCPPPTTKLECGPVWAGSDLGKLKRWGKEFAKIRPARGGSKPRTAAVEAVPVKSAAKKAAAAPKKAAPAKSPAKKGMFGSK